MNNKITILSPGTECWKTRKIISAINNFLDSERISVEFEIITTLNDFLKYKTWILPTIIINGAIVARGYKPSNKKIMKYLNINNTDKYFQKC